jgi:hypothetical protein
MKRMREDKSWQIIDREINIQMILLETENVDIEKSREKSKRREVNLIRIAIKCATLELDVTES